ncbi:hypothetical protein [Sedimenticola selenatireducens]|uniref:hypothetical protein n=1 Tax=Sedimenticola selenatireducens TaxID=191960 RepID=UPI00048E8A96|nr:hypothetical protein [Sedimenticola selenatireducens]
MKYLILSTGVLTAADLPTLDLSDVQIAALGFEAESSLDLFSLLLANIKIIDETMEDDHSHATDVQLPSIPHTALVFPDEASQVQGKLAIQGLCTTEWAEQTQLTHQVKVAVPFTQQQMDLAASLGENFQLLVKDENKQKQIHETLITTKTGITPTHEQAIADSRLILSQLAEGRIKLTRELMAIQQQLGVCNVCRF